MYFEKILDWSDGWRRRGGALAAFQPLKVFGQRKGLAIKKTFVLPASAGQLELGGGTPAYLATDNYFYLMSSHCRFN
jgi:hypothetical protein